MELKSGSGTGVVVEKQSEKGDVCRDRQKEK